MQLFTEKYTLAQNGFSSKQVILNRYDYFFPNSNFTKEFSKIDKQIDNCV
jgi:hypothetical protein